MIDRTSVDGWARAYEQAWRSEGTEQVGELFVDDATYRMGPFEEPHRGIDAIRALWDAERTGPDEEFVFDFEVVAVDPPCAVVYAEVHYGEPRPEHFRDLWVLAFAPDGRCERFEEWPFRPGQRVTG
jgi:ketosteroid isomerase-like protein